jgi:hypothetical protein
MNSSELYFHIIIGAIIFVTTITFTFGIKRLRRKPSSTQLNPSVDNSKSLPNEIDQNYKVDTIALDSGPPNDSSKREQLIPPRESWRCACEGGFLPPNLLKPFGGMEAAMRLGVGQCYHKTS